MGDQALESRMAVAEEKLVSLRDATKAAHERVDRAELHIRDDLKQVIKKVDDLTAFMHQSRGWLSAVAAIAGSLGAVLGHLIGKLL